MTPAPAIESSSSIPRRQVGAGDDVRRRRLLWVAALSVPGAIVHGLVMGNLDKAAWCLVFAGIVTWLALEKSTAPRWRKVLPVCIGVCIAPISCLFGTHGQAELALVSVIPFVIAVMFLDSFDTVVGASVTGWVANIVFFSVQNWPLQELVMFGVVTAATSMCVVLTSAGVRRARKLDVEVEAEHSQALRLSETRRAQAERLAIVGRLASGVAHEINNPLAFVKANIGTLQRALISRDERIEYEELKEILHDTNVGVDRICQIVLDLKGFSREDTGTMEPVDLREACNSASRLAAVRLPRDMKVNLDIPATLPLARANQRKLAQVMLNLLVNSGEALEENRTPNPAVSIQAMRDGDWIRISVTDNGPGIPKEVMARLFEPFFTTKPPGKGTGLGLALSREYITSFGGTLLAQNVTPTGAQFVMTLRVSANANETPLPGSLDLGPSRALFVDRQQPLRRKAS